MTPGASKQEDEMKMKNKLFIAMLAATAMLVACDDKKKETGGGDSDGVPQVCEDYLKKQEACIGKMPDAAKKPMQDAMKTTRDSFKAANTPDAKKALETSCKAMLDAVAKNPACK